MTDLKQSDKSFTYRLIQVLELNSLELNLMNGNVLGKLRQSLSSREVAKTRLREDARASVFGPVSGCAGHWEKIVSLNKSHSATEIWG